jgi:ankyrin repeat protein
MKNVSILLGAMLLLNAICIEGFFWSKKVEDPIDKPKASGETAAAVDNKNTASADPSFDEPHDALHAAAAHGDIHRLEYLLANKMNINIKDSNGWQPIHEAVKSGDLNVVQFLVDHGAGVGERTDVGGTALWWSIHQNGEDHPVSLYLRDIDAPFEGDNVEEEPESESDNEPEDEGSSELHLIASEGNVDAAKQILNIHRDLLSATDANGWQPLHEAVMSSKLEMVKFLVSAGADLNFLTFKGGTPLWWSMRAHGEDHPVTIYLNSVDAVNEGEWEESE